jgi:hypothetical protein
LTFCAVSAQDCAVRPRQFRLNSTRRRSSTGSHFTFATDYGGFDILSDPDGAPRYEALKAAAKKEDVRGKPILFASLDHLIAMKEASGRTKDKLMATEYRVLSDQLRAPR